MLQKSRSNIAHIPRATLLCAFMLSVTACSSDWLGDDSDKQPPLEGERIAILSHQSDLTPDAELIDEPFNIPQARPINEFPSQMAAQQRGVANLAIGSIEQTARETVGEGEGWESALVPSPIVAGGVVYAMDASGSITAHDANDISRIIWQFNTRSDDDDDTIMTGGGLFYSGGVLYSATADGTIVAIVAKDGSLLWRRETGMPIRSAPVGADGQLYVITLDNQLLAYKSRTGQPLWQHRGIRETASYLGTADPAVENGIVLAAYSSGELFALRAEDGSPIWADNLLARRQGSGASGLTGLSATPLIYDNIVYAVSQDGLMAASLLSTGRGLWDLPLASGKTPWLAGGHLFVLGEQNRLYALHHGTRRIRWIRPLNDVQNGDLAPSFSAPMMVGGQILLLDPRGQIILVDADKGDIVSRIDIPQGVHHRPVIAGGKMYLLDQDALLHQYE